MIKQYSQYNGRREVICGKCEEVCPTVAITRDDTTKNFNFSTNRLSWMWWMYFCRSTGLVTNQMKSRNAYFDVLDTPLIIPQNYLGFEMDIERGCFPICKLKVKSLHESHLTLLHADSQCYFYSDFYLKVQMMQLEY